MDKKERQKNISKALSRLDKRFGERIVFRMGESSEMSIETFKTGRSKLDSILGGGYPKGKIIEVYGNEACGKTGLALEAVREVQKEGGIVGFIDAEHALNTEYAESIGVDISDLYISQPSCGEEGIETVRAMVDTGEFDLIVVDSVTALTPRAVLDGEAGEAKIGALARLMSQSLKMITGACSETKTTVMFLNQIRNKIIAYGNPEDSTGGKALKFYASQRIRVKNKGKKKQGDDTVGFYQEIEVVKNKINPPFKKVEFDIVYGVGIDTFGDFIDSIIENKIIVQKGSYFYYNGDKICQGKAKLRIELENNSDLLEELKSKL